MLESLRILRSISKLVIIPRMLLTGAVSAICFQAVLGVLGALPSGKLVESLTNDDAAQVIRSIIMLVSLTVGLQISQFLANVSMTSVSRKIVEDLTKALFLRIQSQNMVFFETTSRGEVLSRLTSDVDSVAASISTFIGPTVQAALMLFGAIVTMFVLDWRLALIALLVVPPWLFLLKLGGARSAVIRARIVHSTDQLRSLFSERLGIEGIVRAKTLKVEQADASAIEKLLRVLTKDSIALTTILSSSWLIVNVVGVILGESTMIAIASWMILHKSLSIGTFITFLFLQGEVFGPLHTLANLHVNVNTNMLLFERVRDMLYDLPAPEKIELQKFDLPFRFKEVLVERNKLQILKGGSIDIGRGEWIGIVGDSGMGKSTFAYALAGLLPMRSSADLNGRHISSIDENQLRRLSIIIPQHDSLITGTVRENLQLGELIEDRLLWSALDLVELKSRILMSENGLSEHIGIGGGALSGGERQRLSIARAILRCPQLLILDEATSALDQDMELRVLKKLKNATNCAVVLVTHRAESLSELVNRFYRFTSGYIS